MTKHIEIVCYFIQEKIGYGNIKTEINLNDQLADIFTKSLVRLRIDYICNKLGTYDLYACTSLRGVLNVTDLAYSLYYSVIMLLILLLFSFINKEPLCVFYTRISILKYIFFILNIIDVIC